MYQHFAKIYDALQDVDYDSFTEYYLSCFKKFLKDKPTLVLDMACGTGNVTIPMSKCGFDMIGLDLSVDMLNIAREKAAEENLDILFLNQDMTEFELYGTVDAIVCALDGVNYITEPKNFEKMLALVKNYLNPGGIFIFDINTVYKFKNTLDGKTFVYDEGDGFCAWSSDYLEDDNICVFNLNMFIPNDKGAYDRFDEYQEEYGYTRETIEEMIENADLKCVGIYDGLTFDAPREDSERLSFIVQK